MDQSLLMWLFGGAFGGIVTLALLFLAHIKECRVTRAAIATLTTQNTQMLKEIGDHETGMRGSIHKLRNDVMPMVLWVQQEQERRRDER